MIVFLIYFFLFSRNRDLTFHENNLQCRQFSWTVKSCFLEKKRIIFQYVVFWKYNQDCKAVKKCNQNAKNILLSFTLRGYILTPFLIRKTSFVAPCLLSCSPVSFWKGSFLTHRRLRTHKRVNAASDQGLRCLQIVQQFFFRNVYIM